MSMGKVKVLYLGGLSRAFGDACKGDVLAGAIRRHYAGAMGGGV